MKVFAEGAWSCPPKIILGIDIGTTQSAVAFAYLYPGGPQTLHTVAAWPGQEAQKGESKIPTLVYYDTDRKAVSFGAEALNPEIEAKAEDDEWQLARHFKLHLHPDATKHKHNLRAQPLPIGVSLLTIYTDFMVYLLKHTKDFFESRIIDGQKVWEDHYRDMTIVLAHPNGWGVKEQKFLRQAAIAANYVPSSNATSQIRFVNEAEASVHSCMFHSDLRNRLKPNTTLAVCDAGESIVDTTIYGVTLAHPVLELEEKQAPACVQAGSIFVESEAERYLHRTLSGAGLSWEDVAEYTKTGVKNFESVLKWSSIDETTDHLIQIGPLRCNHSSIRVRRGRMAISGPVIKGFFDACVNEIIASVDQQLEGLDVQTILLIGEFANSFYLRQVFQKRYEPRGCQILFVDNYSRPIAAAEGAIVWNVMTMHCSAKRAPRFSWGIETSFAFNYDDLDHRDRKTQVSTSGRTLIPGRWHGVVQKGVVIDEGDIVRIPISLDFPPLPSELGEFKLDLYHYSGDDEPVWMRNKQGGLLPKFSKAVHIYTNLSDLSGALNPRIDRDGILQYQLNFDICMRFGGVELVAYSEWEEERTTRTGRCTLVPIIDQA